jgi:PAS domain S-box-containing protein
MAPSSPHSTSSKHLELGLVQSLFDHLPRCPFFVKDRALKYIGANEAMLALCGVRERSELIGRSACDFFPAAVCERYEALDRQVLRTGSPIRDQLDLSIRTRGSPVWLLFARWPVSENTGEVVGVAGVARNLDAPDRRHPNYERLAKIVEYMQSAFHKPLEIADLARQASVSPSQLKRDFVGLFGVSPQRYLTKVRIEAALKMLQGEASIVQVAHACGYADQSAFTRRFKLALGMSPSDYRRRHQDSADDPRDGASPG